MEGPKQTACHDFHLSLGASMVSFAGWMLPQQYSSILDEHKAVRQKAGLFDVSHMGECRVTGPNAAAFLDAVTTAKASALSAGRVKYALLCQEDAGVVDDCLIYAEGQDRFFICLNASNTSKDLAWLRQHINGFDCDITDLSADYAQLALQGPLAEAILNDVPDLREAAALKPFRFIQSGAKMVSRTGYTGEDGFEIYLPPAEAPGCMQALLAAGQSHGLQPCGLGARDSLRLEAGLPLYGHEISESISPVQAGLGRFIAWSKTDFLGKSALEAQKTQSDLPVVIHFTAADRRIPRQGQPVEAEGQAVGEVLSGAFSPILNQPIGSALIKPDALTAKLAVNIRGRLYPIQKGSAPLHRKPV